MTTKDKLLEKILSNKKNVTYNEITNILTSFGFVEKNKGKTSGSRICFLHDDGTKILLHKPHPGNIMKKYAVDIVIEKLREHGDIWIII